jgi:GMP synthase (glutamine-hydrolysing)
MVRIFVVDNGGQWTHREWRVLKYLGVDTKIVPHDTSVEALKAEGVQGLILSGGAPRVGLADSLGNCGLYLDHLDVPVLGICAGHQFMARHFGGQAAPGGSEFGATQLVLQNGAGATPLFKDVPKQSTVWESHHDEVSQVPKDFEVLASSDRCRVQAMQHVTRPLYGLQFHPEVEHSEYGATMFRNFVSICDERKR